MSLWVRVAVIGVVCASQAAAHQTEIIIGRTAAGRLKVEVDGHMPTQLLPSVFPGSSGWAEAHPGFESLQVSNPGKDFFVPSPTANIAFILVSIDPGLTVLNLQGSAPLQVGQPYVLGNPFFDIHPFWNIPGGSPTQVYSVSLFVRDLSGQYTDSEIIGFTMTPNRCYANCDASFVAPLLTANDFQCFLNKVAAGDPYANCDGSTGEPVVTANDFQCFINRYAAGCT